jgi:hypothetical protein
MPRTATTAIGTTAAPVRLAALCVAVLALAGSVSGDTFVLRERVSGAGAIPTKPEVTPLISTTADSEEDHQLAEWAFSRFVEAGLELPPTVVEFVGPSLTPCGGAQATARLAPEPAVVSVCWGSELVILHELAHIWEAHAVSAEQRRLFMLSREGVASWADPADPWADQGREHAANVIAWALMEDPSVIGRTYPNDRASLEEGFVILTGRKPLHLEGGEPVMVDRSAFDSAAARQAAAGRGGIRSGR